MNIIILGSTGMIGKGALLECLADENIENILLINRQDCGIAHEKIKEIIHKDFFDFSPIKEQLTGYNACFFSLGVTSAGLDENAYHRITYEITLSFARTLASVNPGCIFCYISGAGADSTEKGRTMWARVKGKTENALLKLPFRAAYMFRPAYIQPLKGVRSKTRWYNLVYIIFKPIYFLLKPFKSIATDTASLGRAMINVAQKGYPKQVIESRDIYLLSEKK